MIKPRIPPQIVMMILITSNARSNCQNAVPTVTASVASAAAANGSMNRKAAVRRAMEATDDPEG
jgi:hypothetical protein